MLEYLRSIWYMHEYLRSTSYVHECIRNIEYMHEHLQSDTIMPDRVNARPRSLGATCETQRLALSTVLHLQSS